MRRVVEFDLVTKSEANRRGNSKIAQVIHAKEVAKQRAAVGAVLRSNFAPLPLHVVRVGTRFERVGHAIGVTERNAITINLTRIAPGLLDDDNIGAALKHVRDEIAAWVGVPNDRDPIFKWSVPPAQEKSATGVYRVRIEIVDKLTGADHVVRLAETRSAGVQAERRVKRAITKAKKATPDRDPGEEKSARDLAPCSTCRAPIHEGCRADVAGRMVFGVHISRAIAAGLHVPDDDRAKVKPARAARGCSFAIKGSHCPKHGSIDNCPPPPRKLVPAARPAGQAVLPMLRAFAALPWENPKCASCSGSGVSVWKVDDSGGALCPGAACGGCDGTGRAKGRVLTRAARYDGLDEPPTTITASVPAEHVQRYGSTVTLTRQKFDSKATGPCWVYATTDERTTTT